MVSRVLACGTAVVILGFVYLAAAQSYHPRALYIQSSWIPPSGFGACGPVPPVHPCDVFPAGSDVHVGVIVTNVSDHPVTFHNLRWSPATVFEVRDESGNLAPETAELQKLKEKYLKNGEWIGPPKGTQWWEGPMPDDTLVLQPGKQVSFGAMPNRYYDMSRPGVYSIVAKRQNDESPDEWFYSNEIKVTITPKEAGQ